MKANYSFFFKILLQQTTTRAKQSKERLLHQFLNEICVVWAVFSSLTLFLPELRLIGFKAELLESGWPCLQ